MIFGVPLMRVCNTKHLPAALKVPVFCKPMSQAGLRTSGLVLKKLSE